MEMSNLCIIACPYSGTRYTAKYYSLNGIALRWGGNSDGRGKVDWKGTFEGLSKYNEIWHLVRNPLRCVSSLCDLKPSKRTLIFGWLKILEPKSKIVSAMTIWITMNEICEKRASKLIQVESLKHKELQTDINSRTTTELKWQDLFDAAPGLAAKVVQMGEKYNYKIDLEND